MAQAALTHETRLELVHKLATAEITAKQAAKEYEIGLSSVYHLIRESPEYAPEYARAREEWKKQVREHHLATAEGQVKEMLKLFDEIPRPVADSKEAAFAVKVLDGVARRLGLDRPEPALAAGGPTPLAGVLQVLLAGQGATVNIVGAAEQSKLLKERRLALLAEAEAAQAGGAGGGADQSQVVDVGSEAGGEEVEGPAAGQTPETGGEGGKGPPLLPGG